MKIAKRQSYQDNTQHLLISFYLPSFDDGGVERMMSNLMNALVEQNHRVQLLVHKDFTRPPFQLSDQIEIVKVSAKGRKAVEDLVSYLQHAQADILLSVKEEADFVALSAKQAIKTSTKFIVRLPTAIKARFEQRKTNRLKLFFKRLKMLKHYRHADGFIAVADGTKTDFVELFPALKQTILTLKNPVITAELTEYQLKPIEHPWFQQDECPLILGIGGFRRQKDFSSLLKAFAIVRKARNAKLVILGRGRQEARLKQLADELGIAEHVNFPGFSDNPYAWLKRADLFVLSSLWEGSPNVLTEALAIGTPVVSTDCQSGPREVLQDGKYGELVPLQDPEAMAAAMMRTLDKPIESETLQQAVKDYTVEASTQAYLDAFRFFLSQKGKI